MNASLGDDIIVGGDDLVDKGRAQVADLFRIYNNETNEASSYRQMLNERGFETSRFKRPVLIHRRLNALTAEERAGFVASQIEISSDRPSDIVTTAYGPALARLMNDVSPSIGEALHSIAGDWRRLRLAAKEGALWMEATPHLRAAVAAAVQSRAAGRPVGRLILDGALVDTGFTEAAYGFLRLMHADAALSQEANTATIMQRLTALILALETLEAASVPSPAWREIKRGAGSVVSLAERAAAVVAHSTGWAAAPLLKTAQPSATTDFDAMRQVAALNDLPATRLMKRWLDHARNDRDAAARTGEIAELWLGDVVEVLRQQHAEVGDVTGVVSSLQGATRNAFALEALACLAARREARFDLLPPDLSAAFVRHGLDDKAWRRIGEAAISGMIDPARLAEGDMERLAATIDNAPIALAKLDPEAFPVSSMAASFGDAIRAATGGPFAVLFPAAMTMTAVASLAMELKRRLRNEPGLELQSPRAWVAAFQQSGAARLVGDLMERVGDAVDGFAHDDDATELAPALAKVLRASATGGPLWYARRGADRLLWDALQRGRGRDIGAAYVRMARRFQSELQSAGRSTAA
jgi:hypothetical protein